MPRVKPESYSYLCDNLLKLLYSLRFSELDITMGNPNDGEKRNPEIRIPRQQRSRDRVESILEAARVLIGENGSAGLKIQDIAKRARVSAGSMYQYFPNKSAILQALAKQYFEQFHLLLQDSLAEKPQDLESGIEAMHSLFDKFFEVNRKDPVLRDIWLSISSDKTMRDIDLQTSDRNATLLFDTLKHLFAEEQWPGLKRYFLMIVHITPPAIRLALSAEGDESTEYIRITKRLITTSMRDLSVD